MKKTYRELIAFSSYEDRLKYLKLNGIVGESTFGCDRIFNQMFYRSKEWQKIRNKIIARDHGCDLGILDREIIGPIYVHHMNPLSIHDIIHSSENLLDENMLISVSFDTHNYIHYGIRKIESHLPIERSPNDMCPWKK